MTTRYTNPEWLAIFTEALGKDVPKRQAKTFRAPFPGSTEFAACIDHTLLKPGASKELIDHLCEEAQRHKFKSVCVRPEWVRHAVESLRGSSVVVASVIGFHEGTYTMSEKVTEALAAVEAGAEELDMVLNYNKLKEKDYSYVYTDIATVRSCAPHPVILKVILETSQLSTFEIVAACKIAQSAHADFVKTSTGFNGPGASIDNVRLMKATVGDTMKVKASGGVKTAQDCISMLEAGAERIGTSSGVWIMKDAKRLAEGVVHEGTQEQPDSHKSQSERASSRQAY